MRCEPCDKEIFLSLSVAKNAATLYSWVYGKEYDPYLCPVSKDCFHLTTEKWRRRKAREALNP